MVCNGKRLKIAIIGAGSVSFCPTTVSDILRNESIKAADLKISLMDINQEALDISNEFCMKLKDIYKPDAVIEATLDLRGALAGADFVVTAIEKERYFYWSQDFHIPRKYGFRQIYGENGGPGGMFHTLRNLRPMLEIARMMEEVCPDAYLLNYTNPEAKLVGMISKATKIKVVGLCHGEQMGVNQAAKILEMDKEELETEVSGLNHFGVLTKLVEKKTGRDLYPLLREKEFQMEKLALWDELALSRILLRVYGVWVYPGANHIGEYLAWSDQFLASAQMQYFYDPMTEKPWSDISNEPLEFIYSIGGRSWEKEMFKNEKKEGKSRVGASPEYRTEMVSPICKYDDIVTVQELIRKLREAGAFANQSCGIHVHIDASPFDARTLRNITNIMAAKEDLIYKALQVSVARQHRWCQPVEQRFLDDLNSRKPKNMEEVERIWYGGRSRRDTHYDDSRYHCLNLHSVFQKGTVEFRLFNGTVHAGKIKAYIQLCLAIGAQALNQSCASRRKTVTENEKYTFRTWLLRLGLIGDEFKTARGHLLEHLDGCIAWRDPAQALAQKERMRQKKEKEMAEEAERQAAADGRTEEQHMEDQEAGEESPAFTMSM